MFPSCWGGAWESPKLLGDTAAGADFHRFQKIAKPVASLTRSGLDEGESQGCDLCFTSCRGHSSGTELVCGPTR